MQLMLNDQEIEIAFPMTVSQLIDWLRDTDQLSQNNFAVAVNMEFVSRAIYPETQLKAGDQVEIVMPMQGG